MNHICALFLEAHGRFVSYFGNYYDPTSVLLRCKYLCHDFHVISGWELLWKVGEIVISFRRRIYIYYMNESFKASMICTQNLEYPVA